MEDSFKRGPAVDGRVVLGEHGDDLLAGVEPATNVLQGWLLALLKSNTSG